MAIKESSTNNINRQFLTECNLTYAIQLMGGRWKLPILMHVHKGIKRFGELKKSIPNITERMLTLQLKELERDGLIGKIELTYTVTPLGRELIPVCIELHKWGSKHKLLLHGKITPLEPQF
ncbi:helix-turn-helix domain-containing protein [Chitinophaga sp.]|uniref:winged helix-turn-helix transcriptional regulator n=1 Tax=Chitinophaga sp. TaxID=1869181 RepID=UPI002F922924